MPSISPSSPDPANSGSSSPDGETWLTSADLAARWHLPRKTIASWASAGIGPRYSRLGRHRRYRLAAVRAWEGQRLRNTKPSQAGEPAHAATAEDER
ncbi:helix-turn-helix domain-containing protein [Nocardia neocaledoniensis]|uniref:helix-turn-helix domain-containing protein n=1 Tax=Nocardia neocaledoniensis TaxID=236511 RepID=UPI0033D3FF43